MTNITHLYTNSYDINIHVFITITHSFIIIFHLLIPAEIEECNSTNLLSANPSFTVGVCSWYSLDTSMPDAINHISEYTIQAGALASLAPLLQISAYIHNMHVCNC